MNSNSQVLNDKVHYVLVVDKTKSMIGQGDGYGNNIWKDVLNAAEEFIDSLPNKGQVSVYTFADSPSGKTTFDLERSNSKNDLKQFISSITVDGNFTAIYDALNKVFMELVKPGSNEPILIYLFTDGKDNKSRIDFDDILAYYEANRTDYVHAYYIKLRGNIDSALKDKIRGSKGITAIEPTQINTTSVFPITIMPGFMKLSYNLALKNQQTQIFKIQGEKLKSGFKFDAKLTDTDPLFGNIALSKNSGYFFTGENNECIFEIQVYGKLNTEKGKTYKGKIKLSNPDDGIHKISFFPDEFEVEFTNENPPKVIVKQNWKKN